MSTTTIPNLKASTLLRDQLLGEHQRMSALLHELLDAFAENDREDIATAYRELASLLPQHMRFEEETLLPRFRSQHPKEAQAIIAEHNHFRRQLAELGVGIDLHCVKYDVAKQLIDELRAHAEREDKLFYRWAQDKQQS